MNHSRCNIKHPLYYLGYTSKDNTLASSAKITGPLLNTWIGKGLQFNRFVEEKIIIMKALVSLFVSIRDQAKANGALVVTAVTDQKLPRHKHNIAKNSNQ